MITKLTLTIEGEVIDSAKKYAHRNGKSLSGIVENYLRSISADAATTGDISPKVNRLKGVIKLPEPFDYKREIGNALVNKYRKR